MTATTDEPCRVCLVASRYTQPNGIKHRRCLPCLLAANAKSRAGTWHDRYEKNKGQMVAYRRSPAVLERERKRQTALRKSGRFKHKETARATVHRAVMSGQLIVPSVCSRCGGAARIHGHHPDYSKPLEVIWLCPVCHTDIHRALKGPRT